MKSPVSPPIPPLIFLVTPRTSKDHVDARRANIRFARVVAPGTASLAATIATGAWPEMHGVVSSMQAHPDRLGYQASTPSTAAGASIWTRAARSGLTVGVCNWPHPTDVPVDTGEGRVERIESRAIDGLIAPEAAMIPPGTVVPGDLAAPLRSAENRTDRWTLTLLGLETLADRRPDLLIGWMPKSSEATDDAADRFESLRQRLSEVHSRPASLLVLRTPVCEESIDGQSRGGPRPCLEITGDRMPTHAIRPRIDAIAPMIATALRIESTPDGRVPGTTPASIAAGGTARLEAAGLPKALRISTYDLRQHEHEISKRIGASLVARGRSAAASPFLMSAVQSQHGRIDISVLTLLLAEHRRRLGDAAASRLFESVRHRLPESVCRCFTCFLNGDGPAFLSSMDETARAALGRFAAETLLIDLRRRRAFGAGDQTRSGQIGIDAADPD